MFCPSCEEELRIHEIHTEDGGLIVLHVCDRCSGFWLENYQMQQIFEMKDFPMDKIPSFFPVEGLQLIEEGHRQCPMCGNILTLLKKKGFNLEICRDCNGLWIDMDRLKALYYLKKQATPKRHKVILDKSKLNQVTTDITLSNKPKQVRHTPFSCYHDESNEFMARRELELQRKRQEETDLISDYEEEKYQDENFPMNEKVANFCDFITDVFIDPHNRYGIERNRDKNKRKTSREKKGLLNNLYDFLTPDRYE